MLQPPYNYILLTSSDTTRTTLYNKGIIKGNKVTTVGFCIEVSDSRYFLRLHCLLHRIPQTTLKKPQNPARCQPIVLRFQLLQSKKEKNKQTKPTEYCKQIVQVGFKKP